eukprot:PhM_4_TR7268/c0_g1_i1/m.39257
MAGKVSTTIMGLSRKGKTCSIVPVADDEATEAFDDVCRALRFPSVGQPPSPPLAPATKTRKRSVQIVLDTDDVREQSYRRDQKNKDKCKEAPPPTPPPPPPSCRSRSRSPSLLIARSPRKSKVPQQQHQPRDFTSLFATVEAQCSAQRVMVLQEEQQSYQHLVERVQLHTAALRALSHQHSQALHKLTSLQRMFATRRDDLRRKELKKAAADGAAGTCRNGVFDTTTGFLDDEATCIITHPPAATATVKRSATPVALMSFEDMSWDVDVAPTNKRRKTKRTTSTKAKSAEGGAPPPLSHHPHPTTSTQPTQPTVPTIAASTSDLRCRFWLSKMNIPWKSLSSISSVADHHHLTTPTAHITDATTATTSALSPLMQRSGTLLQTIYPQLLRTKLSGDEWAVLAAYAMDKARHQLHQNM